MISEANGSKKNVCFFVGTHGDWGGASRIIFNILRNLDRYNLEPIVMLTDYGLICQELDARGIRYEIWSHISSTNLLKMLSQFWRAIKFYRANKISLVVLGYGCLGWRPPELLAAAWTKIPIVQHCQRVTTQPSPYTRYSVKIVTSSSYIAENSGFRKDIVEPLIDLVDIKKFSTGTDIRSEFGISPNDKVVVFLGRARRSKGIAVFVSLADQLSGLEVSFLIATQRTGTPNDDSLSEHELDGLIHSNPRIHHVPYRDDVENIYATADIVVMPSLAPEPCPAVALEAAASGTPIVAFDIGASREFIYDGESGYLVPADDLNALSTVVRQLLDDDVMRAAIGQRAATLALEHFYENPKKRVNDLYRSL